MEQYTRREVHFAVGFVFTVCGLVLWTWLQTVNGLDARVTTLETAQRDDSRRLTEIEAARKAEHADRKAETAEASRRQGWEQGRKAQLDATREQTSALTAAIREACVPMPEPGP